MKKGSQPIRLGIVDDHPVFRLGLKRMLEQESDLRVVWELGSTVDLITTLATLPVDAVLMDLNLGPGDDSLAATQEVVKRYPRTRVIMISALLDSDAAADSRAAGANGYVPKDLSVAETVSAVRRLATRSVAKIAFGDFLEGRAGAKNGDGSRTHGLTRREQEVLAELRRGRTNKEIANRLGVSIATINKHVQQVLKKLHVRNRSQAVARLHAEASLRTYARDVEARVRAVRSRAPLRRAPRSGTGHP